MLSFNNIGNLEEKFLYYKGEILNQELYKQQIDKFEKLLKDQEFRRGQILKLQSVYHNQKQYGVNSDLNKYKDCQDFDYISSDQDYDKHNMKHQNKQVRVVTRVDLYQEWIRSTKKRVNKIYRTLYNTFQAKNPVESCEVKYEMDKELLSKLSQDFHLEDKIAINLLHKKQTYSKYPHQVKNLLKGNQIAHTTDPRAFLLSNEKIAHLGGIPTKDCPAIENSKVLSEQMMKMYIDEKYQRDLVLEQQKSLVNQQQIFFMDPQQQINYEAVNNQNNVQQTDATQTMQIEQIPMKTQILFNVLQQQLPGSLQQLSSQIKDNLISNPHASERITKFFRERHYDIPIIQMFIQNPISVIQQILEQQETQPVQYQAQNQFPQFNQLPINANFQTPIPPLSMPLNQLITQPILQAQSDQNQEPSATVSINQQEVTSNTNNLSLKQKEMLSEIEKLLENAEDPRKVMRIKQLLKSNPDINEIVKACNMKNKRYIFS
eukprot:403365674